MQELKRNYNHKIMETKKCSKCGRELPVSEFWKNITKDDGLQDYCKDCGKEYFKKRNKPSTNNLKKVFSNPDLAKFTHRQLIDELKARGYSGELLYTQKITL